MYKKILVAVDGSKQSDKASVHGASIAEKCGAELTFLHIIQPIPLYLEMDQASIIKKQRENAEEIVNETIENLKEYDFVAKADITTGNPAEEIIRKSKEHDLVVIGSRGLGLAAGMLLGSVTSRVCRHSSCPVLVVH